MPSSPACMRNAGESRGPIIVGIAMFGGSNGGVWLDFFWWVLGDSWLCSPVV